MRQVSGVNDTAAIGCSIGRYFVFKSKRTGHGCFTARRREVCSKDGSGAKVDISLLGVVADLLITDGRVSARNRNIGIEGSCCTLTQSSVRAIFDHGRSWVGGVLNTSSGVALLRRHCGDCDSCVNEKGRGLTDRKVSFLRLFNVVCRAGEFVDTGDLPIH